MTHPDHQLVNPEKVLRSLKNEIGEAQDWPQLTKIMIVGTRKFVLVRKLSGKKVVFTLNKVEFDELVKLKGWELKETRNSRLKERLDKSAQRQANRSLLPDIHVNDVSISKSGFEKFLVNPYRILKLF